MNPNESTLEEVTLDWLRDLNYTIAHGPDLAPGEAGAERGTYGDVVLEGRLRDSLRRLNPNLPQAALEEAMRKLLLADTPSLIGMNRRFHAMLRDGVTVEVPRQDGSTGLEQVRVIDLVVNGECFK